MPPSLPPGSRVVAGEWWPADYHGPAAASRSMPALAHGMGLKLGDTLTVNVLGRELTARIANLRADRLDLARHQFRDRAVAGRARRRAANPYRAARLLRRRTRRRWCARSPTASPTSRRSTCARRCAASTGSSADRRGGAADRAGHARRGRAGAGRGHRRRAPPPRLRRGGAEGAGRDARRVIAALS